MVVYDIKPIASVARERVVRELTALRAAWAIGIDAVEGAVVNAVTRHVRAWDARALATASEMDTAGCAAIDAVAGHAHAEVATDVYGVGWARADVVRRDAEPGQF